MTKRDAATCEVCAEVERRPGDFVTCCGFLVCLDCAKEKGLVLARMRDELDDELRGS